MMVEGEMDRKIPLLLLTKFYTVEGFECFILTKRLIICIVF